MNRLSRGDTSVTIPGSERPDELGTMAKAVEMFRQSMLETGALREAQEADKARAAIEKQALQRQMADRFEADVKGVVAAVAKATEGNAERRRRDHLQRQRHLAERPRPPQPPRKKPRPASMRTRLRPRSSPPPSPRSAARSPIPARSRAAP